MSKEENILDTLCREAFHKWYESTFVDYLEGFEDAKDKDGILKDIKDLFKV